MKIGVLGAGISGLSFAKLAPQEYNVEILERNSYYGGIASARIVEGVAYHTTGGHCFNSKYPEVMDFVFSHVMPEEKWHHIQRKANIRFHGNNISYPIEYALKQIYGFDEELALSMATDFLAAVDDHEYLHLEDWFRKKFGHTLAEKYFIPYNSKIWNRPPAEMSHLWVEDKLPIPDKSSFFKGLISEENDKMPHTSFYYPNTNNQNTFIDALAEGLHFVFNYEVLKIKYKPETGKWVINDEKEYDILVSTLPLNQLPRLVDDVPASIIELADKLKYNKVTTMLWESADTAHTWTYIPDADSFFHRYIHIGNFFKPRKNYTITEAVGERSYEMMVDNGRKDPFLLRAVDYHVSDQAYVVFDENHQSATSAIINFFRSRHLHPLGRFGEWQYYNMDACIKSSMRLHEFIKETTISEGKEAEWK
jgi:protoporphyrinogen oxidase